MNSISIIIFDDTKLVRDSLSQTINDMESCFVVGAFENCGHLFDDIEACNPDLILMDISMPEMDGVEAVKLIRTKYRDLPILMQTVFEDDDSIFNAIAAGANGYILKNAGAAKLAEYIHEALDGGAPMSPSVARKVLSQFQQQRGGKESFHLSEREVEVLGYFVKGLPHKQIAGKMNVTYDTVRFHTKKIYEKLHVSSLTEAVVKAVKFKLV